MHGTCWMATTRRIYVCGHWMGTNDKQFDQVIKLLWLSMARAPTVGIHGRWGQWRNHRWPSKNQSDLSSPKFFVEFFLNDSSWILPFQSYFLSVSPVLRQAALNYMSDSDCFDLYQNANLDTTDDMQCFGTRQSSSPHQDWIAGHRPFRPTSSVRTVRWTLIRVRVMVTLVALFNVIFMENGTFLE